MTFPGFKEQCDAAGVEVRNSSHRKGVTVSFYRPDWSRLGQKNTLFGGLMAR